MRKQKSNAIVGWFSATLEDHSCADGRARLLGDRSLEGLARKDVVLGASKEADNRSTAQSLRVSQKLPCDEAFPRSWRRHSGRSRLAKPPSANPAWRWDRFCRAPRSVGPRRRRAVRQRRQGPRSVRLEAERRAGYPRCSRGKAKLSSGADRPGDMVPDRRLCGRIAVHVTRNSADPVAAAPLGNLCVRVRRGSRPQDERLQQGLIASVARRERIARTPY